MDHDLPAEPGRYAADAPPPAAGARPATAKDLIASALILGWRMREYLGRPEVDCRRDTVEGRLGRLREAVAGLPAPPPGLGALHAVAAEVAAAPSLDDALDLGRKLLRAAEAARG